MCEAEFVICLKVPSGCDDVHQVGELIAVIAEDGEDWQEVAKAAPAAGEAAGEVDEGATTTTGQEEEEDAAGPSGGSTPAILMNMPALRFALTLAATRKFCLEI